MESEVEAVGEAVLSLTDTGGLLSRIVNFTLIRAPLSLSWIIRASITFQCLQILTDFTIIYMLFALTGLRPTENPLP